MPSESPPPSEVGDPILIILILRLLGGWEREKRARICNIDHSIAGGGGGGRREGTCNIDHNIGLRGGEGGGRVFVTYFTFYHSIFFWGGGREGANL